MAKINLKNILGKNKPFFHVISTLIDQCSVNTWIEDENEKVLVGEKDTLSKLSFPVLLENEVVGKVKGDEQSKILSELISQLMQKELEKKSLGSEVLNLYQEINVIFNFTEKLTQAIEPDVIAKLTLEQACHSISSNSGIIVLWDDQQKKITIPASSGDALINQESIINNAELLLKIGLGGHSEIVTDISQLKKEGILEEPAKALIYAAMKVKHRIMGAVILAGNSVDQFSAGHLKLLVTLALQSSAAIESALLYEKNIRESKEREEAILRIHEFTKKFVPNEFIRSLGKERITDIKLGDQVEKIVTVLFTDIRDFTTLSETMTPEENFRFVSSFNAQLGPIIRSNNGFINQYLGDSIMAIFPGNPVDAMNAAIAMQKAVQELNSTRRANGLLPIHAGIGMHTGPLIMGITGDEQRMDAATISDTVNTAARIEGLTKHYKTSMLVSQETIDNINADHYFHLRYLGSVRLKGKNKLLTIIECFDGTEQSGFDKKLNTLPSFKKAMDLYHARQFEAASSAFQSVLSINPDDLTAQYFLNNARSYHAEGIPQNWTGIEEMVSK